MDEGCLRTAYNCLPIDHTAGYLHQDERVNGKVRTSPQWVWISRGEANWKSSSECVADQLADSSHSSPSLTSEKYNFGSAM